jgi:hypothetical protein
MPDYIPNTFYSSFSETKYILIAKLERSFDISSSLINLSKTGDFSNREIVTKNNITIRSVAMTEEIFKVNTKLI